MTLRNLVSMRNYLRVLVSFFCLVVAFSCVWAQDMDVIRTNPNYVCGQGFGETLQAADENAVKDLVSQISVNINSQTQTTISNEQSGETAKSSVSTAGVLQVSSNVSLANCKRIVSEVGNSFIVLRYVERSEIDKMFDTRKAKINDLIRAGERAESLTKLGDALRNYYWAIKLISSIPEEHSSNLVAASGLLLSTEIKERMVNIMDSCKVAAQRMQGNDDKHMVEMAFTYKGRPVTNCDYLYFDGYDWMPASVKDGVAVADVPTDASQIRVRLEYVGEKLWKSDPMINDILSSMPSVLPFPQFEKRINIAVLQEEKPQPAPTVAKVAKEMEVDTLAVCNKREIYQQADIVAPIIKAIETRDYSAIPAMCTQNGWKWFEKLIKYGNAKIIERDNLQVSAFANGYLVRGVKASFSFKKNKSFVEDLVFYIKDDKIEGINFGLEQNALEDILRHSMWDPQSRLVLVNFLENYKTAYALERVDYLESVFSDDALIIIGNKIPQQKKADVTTLNQESYQHNRLTKSEYMERLRQVFAKQEYVNIQFEDASVKKTSRSSERYEIIIKQHYYSTTYADKGYLYLLADISNPEMPIIHVRVWDEDKNNLMNYGEWVF